MSLPAPEDCPLAVPLAARLRAEREGLTRHWLDRIAARVSLDAGQLFPSDDLLDHVPVLIDGIAEYLEHPWHEAASDPPVVAKALELGELRHAQGFDAYQILKDYEILGGILFTFLSDEIARLRESEATAAPTDAATVLVCAQRLFRALALVQQHTATQYLQLARARVHDHEERLRAFNRALSHELKNRISAVLGAAELLGSLGELEDVQRTRFTRMIARNAREMQTTLTNLLDLSRLETDARQQRHAPLPRAAAEVVRQLRDSAASHAVEVRLGRLPPVEVNAAAVELVLTNFLSNAIKYCDPDKPERWVEIAGSLERGPPDIGAELVVRVRDNGLGVPAAARGQLFERFFRAHEPSTEGIDGTGLGLSIVRETAEALGGRAWAEFPEEGSVFVFAVPCRRVADREVIRKSAREAPGEAGRRGADGDVPMPPR